MLKIIAALISATSSIGLALASINQYYYQGDQISSLANQHQKTSFFLINNDRISAIVVHNKSTTNYLSDGKSENLLIGPSSQQTIDYRAYGQGTKDNAIDNFGYNGEYQDPITKLAYLRARDYNPGTQTFMTRDSYPIWNHYSFANTDPVSNIDPSGHFQMKWQEWLSIGLGTAALIGGIMNYHYSVNFQSLDTTNSNALANFALKHKITDIHVDVDDTLIKVKKMPQDDEDWYPLPEGMSSKYDAKAGNYAAKVNHGLLDQLIEAKAAGIKIHILSTGSWQETGFRQFFSDSIKFDSFTNKQDIDTLLTFKPSKFGSIAKAFTKWRAIDSKNSLLIDGQSHQRLGFWLFGTTSYAMDPGAWLNQDFTIWIDNDAREI